MSITFTHIRCPLHRYTFSVKAIRDWVEQICEGRVLNLFAGKTRLRLEETRNDLDPEMPAEYHKDALTFLRSWNGEKFHTFCWIRPMPTASPWSFIRGSFAAHLGN